MEKESIFSKIPELNYQEPVPDIDPAEFVKVVESRRSVRVYSREPIPESVMRKCLDLALLAPNSSNLQCWEFYWVRSEPKKAALVEACFSQPAARTAAELVVAVARTKSWKKNAQQMIRHFETSGEQVPESVKAYYHKLVPLAYSQGPFGVFGLLKRPLFFLAGLFRPIPREPAGINDMKIWATKSTALACENFMLALRAYGYDSCPMEGLDSRRVRKILGLPSDALVVMAISAGKRAAQGVYGPRIRFDSKQFIKEV